MKKIFKYVITFIVVIISFNILLFLTSLFPSRYIEEKVKESTETLFKEGNLYDFGEHFYTTNNNFTDALMINEAYSIDNKNPIYSYMAVRKNYKENQTKQEVQDRKGELISINNGEVCKGSEYDIVGELKEFVEGKTEISVNYARYWHGYLPFLRVLLIFLNVEQIRYMLFGIFVLLFLLVLRLIKEKLSTSIAVIFGYSLIVEGYFLASYSLESAPVFIVMMLACIILLKRIEKIKDFYGYIFIIACITNFVDYLTVPIITLAMPLYLYILYQQKKEEKTFKYYFKIIFKTSIIWGMGYALTWLTKWILYDILYHQGLIKSAITQVMYRTGNDSPWVLEKIIKVIQMILAENIAYIGLYAAIITNFWIIKGKVLNLKKQARDIKTKLPILLISFLPFFWYVFLANHTVMHIRFTYRNMIIFVFGILAFITEVRNLKNHKENILQNSETSDKIK